MPHLFSIADTPELWVSAQEAAIERHRDHWQDDRDDGRVQMIDPFVVRDWTGHGTLMLSAVLWDWDRPVSRDALIDMWNCAVTEATPAMVEPEESTMTLLAAIATIMRAHTAASVVDCLVTGVDDPDYSYTLRCARQPELDGEIRGGLGPW